MLKTASGMVGTRGKVVPRVAKHLNACGTNFVSYKTVEIITV